MKFFRRLLLLVVVLCVAIFAGLDHGLEWHPDLGPYKNLMLKPSPAPHRGELRVTWLGVSTLLFDDGESAFITDGFFSRPSALQTAVGLVAPDRAAITAALARAGVKRLTGVVVLHSHYDHAMDAPVVAELTGAKIIGSESTAFIARGQKFPEQRLIGIAAEGGQVTLGRFHLKLIGSVHAPEDHFPGTITKAVVPPSRASAYRTGTAYSLLVEHAGKTVLVQSSAGFVPGALQGEKAQTVLLGIGLLGKMKDSYRDAYWRELVQTVGARRVIAIHWDDFFRPLSKPIVALPRLADRIPVSLDFLREKSAAESVRLNLPVAFQPFDPF